MSGIMFWPVLHSTVKRPVAVSVLLAIAAVACVAAAPPANEPPSTTSSSRPLAAKTNARDEKKKGEAGRAEAAKEEAAGPQNRLREGSRIVDQVGEFHDTGDRIIFQSSDSNVSFPTLENLALERISRVLDETPGRRQWTVTGTVTEYRGANYLFVVKAVLKSKRALEKATVPVDKSARDK